MDIGKDLVAASATPLVLAILGEGENYGYAIIKRVEELSGGELQWTDGMLYPVLHRLERNGLVKASWGRSESGRRGRRLWGAGAWGGGGAGGRELWGPLGRAGGARVPIRPPESLGRRPED